MAKATKKNDGPIAVLDGGGAGACVSQGELTDHGRALAGALLSAAAKKINPDGLKLDAGAHGGAVTVTSEGDVLVEKAGESQSATVSAEDVLSVILHEKKFTPERVTEIVREIKSAQRSKVGQELHAARVKVVREAVKTAAIKLGMSETKERAGAVRCDPTVSVAKLVAGATSGK